MEKNYVIRTDTSISKPMKREEAIKKVREYDHKGISAYIVSEEEGKRLEKSEFNIPRWS